jgi:capsular exopolysaccharide synthesis family protein
VFRSIGTFHQIPIYTATAKLQIDAETPNILPYKEVYSQDSSYYRYDDYIQTQVKIIQSRSLAKRVIQVARLDRDPAFVGKVDEKTFRADSPADAELKSQGLVDRFLGGLRATPIKNSTITEISFSSTDPKLAARIVNIVANEYVQQNFEAKYDATNRATDFLQKQLVDLKAKVEKAEEELLRYARSNDIMNVSDKSDVTSQTLGDLNTELTKAQTERINKESFYKGVADATPENFPQALRTAFVRELEESLAKMEQDLARLKAQYGPEWPEVKKLQNQMEKVQSQLRQERLTAIKNARTEYESAVQREKLVSIALENQKGVTHQVTEAGIHYNILKREVETNKQLYDGLLQRMKEAGVSAGLKSSNVRVIDKAEIPSSPSSPGRQTNLLYSVLVGLVAGLALAFFLEYMDNTVKTPEDVEKFVSLPSLGLIPSLESALGRSTRYLPLPGLRRKIPEWRIQQGVELVPYMDSKSLVAEAYRSLRTSILLSSPDNPPKTIMVTSAKAGEGKTTTACNTAASLAQTGARVLLIDCDMRRPNVNKIFGLNGGAGLTEFLTGQREFADVTQQSKIPNLYVVTCGAHPPNPAELLGSTRMAHGIRSLCERFDYILFDTPPVLSVTDALVMAPLMDGVILVIQGAKTPRDVLNKAKKNLLMVNARILGVLINRVDMHSHDYSYYYRDYYDYGSYISGEDKTA